MKASRGFTIVELLIVIVVIGILAAISIVSYTGIQQRSQASAAQSALAQANKKLALYLVDNGSYPLDQTAFNSLVGGSSGTAYSNYTANNTTPTPTFCVTATTGSTSYYTTQDGSLSSGSCPNTSGLIGWWRFNGDATDTSGSANNGTITNAAPAIGQNGQANSAYSFTGSNSYISSSSNSFPLGSSARTVTAWVNTTGYPGTGWRMINSYGVATTSNAAALSINTSGRLSFNSQSNDWVSSLTLAINEWHLVGYILTGTQISILYDEQSLSTTLGSSPNTLTGTNYIGSWTGGANYWTGQIDDVRIYNRALSAGEVAALYSAGAQ